MNAMLKAMLPNFFRWALEGLEMQEPQPSLEGHKKWAC